MFSLYTEQPAEKCAAISEHQRTSYRENDQNKITKQVI